MKKKIFILVILIILIISSLNVALGEETERYINVRIRSPRMENEYINISGKENLKIKIGSPIESNMIVNTQSKNLTVKIDSYYSDGKYYNEFDTKAKEGPFHIILRKSFENFSESAQWLEEVELENNLEGFVYFDGEKYYTAFGRYTSKEKAQDIAESIFENYDYDVENHKSKSILVLNNKGKIIFSYENNFSVFFTVEKQEENTIFFDGVEYHGNSAFYIIDEYKLLSINKVPVEDYLKGVVPSEIPASWYMEALKAQAVAARTYAVSYTNNSIPYGYHVVDNQNSQVYNGINKEYSSTNKAVEETENQLIYYNNNLISAFYHSTSGGKTADSGNVWNYTLPYLKSKEDVFSNISPHTEWSITYTKEELIDLLSEEFKTEDIYDMDVGEVSHDERVLETSIKTDKGEIKLIKEETRAVLGYSKLKSTWFNISKNNQLSVLGRENKYEINIAENTKISFDENQVKKDIIGYNKTEEILNIENTLKIKTSPDIFTLEGRGWGHGIGMSQYGAKQMAEEGFTYKEILEYYYTGVTVK